MPRCRPDARRLSGRVRSTTRRALPAAACRRAGASASRRGAANMRSARPSCCMPSRGSATSSSPATCRWWPAGGRPWCWRCRPNWPDCWAARKASPRWSSAGRRCRPSICTAPWAACRCARHRIGQLRPPSPTSRRARSGSRSGSRGWRRRRSRASRLFGRAAPAIPMIATAHAAGAAAPRLEMDRVSPRRNPARPIPACSASFGLVRDFFHAAAPASARTWAGSPWS